MRKMSKALLLGVSVLFLLSTIFMACGNSEAGNSSVKTPIERLQSLELGVLDVQSMIDKASLDYNIIQYRVDQIRDDLDIMYNMYNEITSNISILHQRIDTLEETINGS